MFPPGARLFVTTGPSIGSSAGFNAVLTHTGPNGEGSLNAVPATATLFCPLTASSGLAAAEIPVVNGTAMAVWEVTETNSAALEAAVFGVAIAYTPDAPNRLPGLGLTSVSGNFGPFYAPGSDAGVMSASLPIPRFIDNPQRVDAFRIDSCVTNLLFPFVTNQSGFDTGIAVANTSRDPFGVTQRPQTGSCTVNYYGASVAGPAPPPQTTSSAVEPGYNDGLCVVIGRQPWDYGGARLPGISDHPVRFPLCSRVCVYHGRSHRNGSCCGRISRSGDGFRVSRRAEA